ncbi:Glycopeptide resistance-associated protein R [uncultured Eubacterium sp.]|nr:Glycopeptide resistance-associated protein R [uncultured Eubacterium sp.]
MAKILIVEDDETIAQELSLLLSNANHITERISDFSDVTKQILSSAPDLVLLDVSLPAESGLTVCSRLRRSSNVPVIFVTAAATSMDELNCILQGGDDYITKPYEPPVLLARIGAVLKRTMQADTDSKRLTAHGLTLDLASAVISYEGRQAELTKNEWKILSCLIRHQGEIVSRAQLIDYLWDNQVFIDDNALSVNMTRLRGRLSELGMENFIITKRGMGYLIP